MRKSEYRKQRQLRKQRNKRKALYSTEVITYIQKKHALGGSFLSGFRETVTVIKKLTFDNVLRKAIYKNRNALYDLTPAEGLVGRIQERNDLVMELSPILLGSPVSSVFIYGTPGTGKTGLTTEVCNELQKEADKHSIELHKIYINCSENRTEYAVLTELLAQLSNTDVPRTGWSTKKVLATIKSTLSSTANVLVVLDEVDYILRESGDDILYWLSRINTSAKSKLSTIVISNDVRVYDYLTPRTNSSFGRVKIIFSAYTTEDLIGILSARAKDAFLPKSISKVVLARIADIESERGGDARKALELMDACAKIALAQGKTTISLDTVDKADRYLEQDTLVKRLMGLTKHQKVLYLALLKSKANSLGPQIYLDYVKECKSFKLSALSERRIRTFLVFFHELGLIHTEVGWVADLKKKSRKITLTLDQAIKIKIRKKVRDSI